MSGVHARITLQLVEHGLFQNLVVGDDFLPV